VLSGILLALIPGFVLSKLCFENVLNNTIEIVLIFYGKTVDLKGRDTTLTNQKSRLIWRVDRKFLEGTQTGFLYQSNIQITFSLPGEEWVFLVHNRYYLFVTLF
jgi:hypothetical protein